MKSIKYILMALSLICLTGQSVLAVEQAQIEEAIKENLKEKTKVSGTLDIFDAKNDKVRNLKFLEFQQGVDEVDGMSVMHVDFRDLNTGDIVDVDVKVALEDGQLMVKEYTIHKIQEKKDDPELANKKYTDAEIQDVMIKYLEQKSKFTNTFDLYDEKLGKMRNLSFVEVEPKVRKFGKLSISTVKFTDASDQSEVKLDMTVENNKGVLKVKSVRFIEK